jgi:hypothetical protein
MEVPTATSSSSIYLQSGSQDSRNTYVYWFIIKDISCCGCGSSNTAPASKCEALSSNPSTAKKNFKNKRFSRDTKEEVHSEKFERRNPALPHPLWTHHPPEPPHVQKSGNSPNCAFGFPKRLHC